jgi:hypothetical protein
MNDWRTIDSAPKDGTRILLFDNGYIAIGRWSDDARFGNEKYGPGWQIFECEMDEWYAIATDTATHWMPLPSPPRT